MTAHVYTPDHLPCGNGCHTGHGETRTPVLCEGQARICPRCIDRLDTWLRQLPETYSLLPFVVEHGTVGVNPETATTKRPDPPAPLRLEVLDLLDERPGRGALGLVRLWADLVRDQRHITSQLPDVQLLLAHLPWITQQEWVVEFYAELKPLVRELLDRVGEYRQRPVGVCMAMVRWPGLVAEVFCGGPLYLDRDRRGCHCAACGQHWDGADPALRRLGRVVGLLVDDGVTEPEGVAS